MDGEAGVVDGFDSYVMCRGFALDGLAVMCSGEVASMLVDACVIQVKSSEEAGVIDDVVQEGKLKVA